MKPRKKSAHALSALILSALLAAGCIPHTANAQPTSTHYAIGGDLRIMPDHTPSLLLLLKIGSAEIIGYNLDGNVSVSIAIPYPNPVSRFICVATRLLTAPTLEPQNRQ
jgi:hypothetical protein